MRQLFLPNYGYHQYWKLLILLCDVVDATQKCGSTSRLSQTQKINQEHSCCYVKLRFPLLSKDHPWLEKDFFQCFKYFSLLFFSPLYSLSLYYFSYSHFLFISFLPFLSSLNFFLFLCVYSFPSLQVVYLSKRFTISQINLKINLNELENLEIKKK